MRSKGEGTIQKLPNGRYRGVLPNNGKRFFGPSVERRQEALPAARKALARKGASPSSEIGTLRSGMENLLAERWPATLAPTTLALYRHLFESRIARDPIADLRIESIDDRAVASWFSRQTGAPKTKRNALTFLKTALRQLGRPIGFSYTVPPRDTLKVATPEEWRAILAMPLTEKERLAVLLAGEIGLRRSEILGLMHEDRDEDGVNIRRAIVQVTGAPWRKPPKTMASATWVPLTSELQAMVGGGRRGYVLTDAEDPATPSWIKSLAERIKRVVPGFGWHSLRRMCAMRMLESGVDVRTAAEITRHDPAVLLKVYSRSRRDLKRQALASVAERSSNK